MKARMASLRKMKKWVYLAHYSVIWLNISI
jgi:hypothetical protein